MIFALLACTVAIQQVSPTTPITPAKQPGKAKPAPSKKKVKSQPKPGLHKPSVQKETTVGTGKPLAHKPDPQKETTVGKGKSPTAKPQFQRQTTVGTGKSPTANPQLQRQTTLRDGAKDDPLGSGPAAKAGDVVTVEYLVKRPDGSTVSDSKRLGFPYTFKLGEPGNDPLFDLVVSGMKTGGTRRTTVSAAEIYGEQGAPPVVGPKDTLVVIVTLLRRGDK
jgi:FKBP-type peptidyl-prolyl cis-trans isomerase